jgi:hypothetical protein
MMQRSFGGAVVRAPGDWDQSKGGSCTGSVVSKLRLVRPSCHDADTGIKRTKAEQTGLASAGTARMLSSAARYDR